MSQMQIQPPPPLYQITKELLSKIKLQINNDQITNYFQYINLDELNHHIGHYFENGKEVLFDANNPNNSLNLSILKTEKNNFYLLIKSLYRNDEGGNIQLAINCSSHQLRAIKVLTVNALNKIDYVKVKNEIKISDHMGLLLDQQTIKHDFKTTKYLLLPFFPKNLKQLIEKDEEKQSKPKIIVRLRLLRKIVEAILDLHQKNILHGDIYLDNLMITKSNISNAHPDFIDFGESKSFIREDNKPFPNLIKQSEEQDNDVKHFLRYVCPNILLWVSEDVFDDEIENIPFNTLKTLCLSTEIDKRVDILGGHKILKKITTEIDRLIGMSSKTKRNSNKDKVFHMTDNQLSVTPTKLKPYKQGPSALTPNFFSPNKNHTGNKRKRKPEEKNIIGNIDIAGENKYLEIDDDSFDENEFNNKNGPPLKKPKVF